VPGRVLRARNGLSVLTERTPAQTVTPLSTLGERSPECCDGFWYDSWTVATLGACQRRISGNLSTSARSGLRPRRGIGSSIRPRRGPAPSNSPVTAHPARRNSSFKMASARPIAPSHFNAVRTGVARLCSTSNASARRSTRRMALARRASCTLSRSHSASTASSGLRPAASPAAKPRRRSGPFLLRSCPMRGRMLSPSLVSGKQECRPVSRAIVFSKPPTFGLCTRRSVRSAISKLDVWRARRGVPF
jgi:hypothetical protein